MCVCLNTFMHMCMCVCAQARACMCAEGGGENAERGAVFVWMIENHSLTLRF